MYYRAESLQMLCQLQQSMSLWGIPALHHCYVYILNIDVRVKDFGSWKRKTKNKTTAERAKRTYCKVNSKAITGLEVR